MKIKLQPPAHLSVESQELWSAIVKDYQLEQHHLRLLTLACESHDRGTQARETLAESGVVFTDKHGQPRAHPCVAIERDSRIAFARLMRELSLEGGASSDNRPPRVGA